MAVCALLEAVLIFLPLHNRIILSYVKLHEYWSKEINPLPAKFFNFYSLDVVSHYSDLHLQLGENYSVV